MSQKPGDRIESQCSRCNDCTGHVIIAIVDGEIIKVQCCACGSVHKYRPPRTTKSTTATATVRRISAGSDRKAVMAETRPEQKEPSAPRQTAAVRRAAANANETEQRWRKAMERPSAPEARTYAIDMPLGTGDVVNHPVFGMGVVQSVTRPDKAVILFRDASRPLRCVVN